MINILFIDNHDETVKSFRMVRVWRSRRIRLWIPSRLNDGFVRNCKDRKIIDESVPVENDVICYEWDKNTCSAQTMGDQALKAMIERIRVHSIDFVIVGQPAHVNSQFIAFRDAINRADLPDCFFKVPWFSSNKELEAFLEEKGVFDIVLNDTSRFLKTSLQGEGTPVYREISTGNLIYKDILHLTHYEVFDKQGKHLGEMSRDGVMDCTKRDAKKHIDLS